MIDTSCGLATAPYPGAEAAQRFARDAVTEAVTAEQAGFEGVFVPGRHARGGLAEFGRAVVRVLGR